MKSLSRLIAQISLALLVALPSFTRAGPAPLPADSGELARLSGLGDINSVRALLAKGAATTFHEPLRGATALHNASAQGHLEIVRSLLDAGAQVDAVDADGSTALVYAAYHGRAQVVRYLLKVGAAPDHRPDAGPTALVAACLTGRTEAVLLLVAAGASPDLPDANGLTPRAAAAIANRADVLRALDAKPSAAP